MTTEIAQKLRRNQTDAERRLWQHLRNHRLAGHKFRRQYPLTPYVVDFICLERKLIIELDGGQHVERQAADAQRTAFLQERRFRVIRFWNDEILRDTETVLEVIRETLAVALRSCFATTFYLPLTLPSPHAGRGDPGTYPSQPSRGRG